MESLILTGNHIDELGDIDPLVTLENLTTLSLLHNPVTAEANYRLYVIFKLPQLRLLDFRKIRMKEREEAKALFRSKKGKESLKEISNRSLNKGTNEDTLEKRVQNGPPSHEVRKIREAINKASSLEEVERLQKLLQAGQLPDDNQNGKEILISFLC